VLELHNQNTPGCNAAAVIRIPRYPNSPSVVCTRAIAVAQGRFWPTSEVFGAAATPSGYRVTFTVPRNRSACHFVTQSCCRNEEPLGQRREFNTRRAEGKRGEAIRLRAAMLEVLDGTSAVA